MEIKENLKKNVKEWIKLDSEISTYKKEIKTRLDSKKKISEELIKIMKNDNIDCFNIPDGSLVYKKNIVKKSINSKTLLLSLKKYYANLEEDSKLAEELTKFILDNREEQIKENIKRKINS